MTFPRIDFAPSGAAGFLAYWPFRIWFSVCVSMRVMLALTRLMSASLLMTSWKLMIGHTVYPGHESVAFTTDGGGCASAGIASILTTIATSSGRGMPDFPKAFLLRRPCLGCEALMEDRCRLTIVLSSRLHIPLEHKASYLMNIRMLLKLLAAS